MKKLLIALVLFASPVFAQDYKSHLIHWEGESSVPYQTKADKSSARWHIGIGHVLTPRDGPIEMRYTHAQIDAFFSRDLSIALAAARKEIVRFDSLPNEAKIIAVSLAFSCGANGFKKFVKFNHALSSRDFHLAREELSNSLWAKQVGKWRKRDAVNLLMRAGKL